VLAGEEGAGGEGEAVKAAVEDEAGRPRRSRHVRRGGAARREGSEEA
jgi:hypothetical protein